MVSFKHRKLHKQFFYALVAQSLGPTVLLVIPAAPILLTPLLHPYMNMEFNWQTGWLYSLMGLYPPFDSIAFMLIVSEYRKVIIGRLCYLLANHPFKQSTSVTNTTVPRPQAHAA
uniref:G_PROTEIN_RECEP_F1_2 domain-containing protein n=1 Tax=Caenorhabditis tropicalis TaxID=1561998 RepID=A0A1I7T6S3_9PELO